MSKKRAVLGLFLLCLAFFAVSRRMEARQQKETGQRQEMETYAAENNRLNLQLDAEISTLDPQAAVDSASFEVIAGMLEGLYRMDEQDRPEPAMAEHVEILEDGKKYRFTLTDAVWSDGTPVQAGDFVYGWHRGIDRQNGNENAFLFATAGIRNAEAVLKGEMSVQELGIRALDERTLEVELEKPCPYFISMLTLPLFFPLNEEFYEQWGDQYGTSPQSLLSNGPFLIEEYQPSGQEISLVKNPLYHEAEQIKLEEIHYQVIKDSQQAVMAYESGLLDMVLLSGTQTEIYLDSPDFQSIPLSSLWYLSPNGQNRQLGNTALRRALMLSFDKTLAAEEIMRDGSLPASGVIPRNFAYGPGGQDFRDDHADRQENKNESIGKELAQTFMEQAKAELGADEFTFSLLIEDSDTARNLGQFLQEEIQQTLPEVTIRLETVPKKVRLERMGNGDYELGLSRWGADYPDPLAFFELWTSTSPFNYGKWSNSDYDRLIFSIKNEFLSLPEQRWEAFHQCEDLLMEEAAVFPVCEKAYGILLRRCVKGAQFHGTGINRVWSRCWKESDP